MIIVIIGGGIAGISCIEALFQLYDESNPQYSSVILISNSKLVKRATNYELIGRRLERFDVVEDDIDELASRAPQGLEFKSIIGSVTRIDSRERIVVYRRTSEEVDPEFKLPYNVLCLCNGSEPRRLQYTDKGKNPEIDKRIIVIRDTDTLNELRLKLQDSSRLVIVGNGGISLELVSKISDCKKFWIIRDESIGFTFFDSGAGKFILDSMINDKDFKPLQINEDTRIAYSASSSCPSKRVEHYGPSLGPNWSQNLELRGKSLDSNDIEISYRDEVASINLNNEQGFPIKVITKNGKQIDCDLVALAIGVKPNSNLNVTGEVTLEVSSSEAGGILIDDQMRTSIEGIYAAGDVVSCENWPRNQLWFQMRLWTQARQMGYYTGRCISAHLQDEDPSIYFNFDCFTHSTSFFGYKLVLLGKFNGQSIGEDGEDCDKYEVIARVNPGKDYVKVLMKDGIIIGAVLVGESGLEETIENLIHDRIDISRYKEHLLDDTVDIEDYFD